MRTERIDLVMSTAALDATETALEYWMAENGVTPDVEIELKNLTNEIRARLQRTDQDPHAPVQGDWLDN